MLDWVGPLVAFFVAFVCPSFLNIICGTELDGCRETKFWYVGRNAVPSQSGSEESGVQAREECLECLKAGGLPRRKVLGH
jgi:hypothetical protein